MVHEWGVFQIKNPFLFLPGCRAIRYLTPDHLGQTISLLESALTHLIVDNMGSRCTYQFLGSDEMPIAFRIKQ